MRVAKVLISVLPLVGLVACATQGNSSNVESLVLYPASEVELTLSGDCYRVFNPLSGTLIFVPLQAKSLEGRLREPRDGEMVVRSCSAN